MTDKVDRDGAKDLIDIGRKSRCLALYVMLRQWSVRTPDPDSELAHYLQEKQRTLMCTCRIQAWNNAILRPSARRTMRVSAHDFW